VTAWHPPIYAVDRIIGRLVAAQGSTTRTRRLVHHLLKLRGTDIAPEVTVPKDIVLPHAASGVVINGSTRIGRDVTIYQRVTIGRADIWQPRQPGYVGVELGDHAILCAGAVVITATHLRVGEGTIVGANSVLTESTGDWEIWAGSPARKVGDRGLVAASA
jgi:serine acetyltransferase